MQERFSEFHEIGGLTDEPDANGMTERMFGAPRAGEVEPTILTRADGLSVALPTFEFGLVLAGALAVFLFGPGGWVSALLLAAWAAAVYGGFVPYWNDATFLSALSVVLM